MGRAGKGIPFQPAWKSDKRPLEGSGALEEAPNVGEPKVLGKACLERARKKKRRYKLLLGREPRKAEGVWRCVQCP